MEEGVLCTTRSDSKKLKKMEMDFRWRQQHEGSLQEVALNSRSCFSTSASKEVNIHHSIASRQQRNSLSTRSKRKNMSSYHCHHPAQKEALSKGMLWSCSNTMPSEDMVGLHPCNHAGLQDVPLSPQEVCVEASSLAGLADNQCLLSTLPRHYSLVIDNGSNNPALHLPSNSTSKPCCKPSKCWSSAADSAQTIPREMLFSILTSLRSHVMTSKSETQDTDLENTVSHR